jgi:hypothetical protein
MICVALKLTIVNFNATCRDASAGLEGTVVFSSFMPVEGEVELAAIPLT